jgi:hypothetical protein
MSYQTDNNRPSDCESEDRLIKNPEQLLERLFSRRNLFAKSLGAASVLGALSFQAGADTGQAGADTGETRMDDKGKKTVCFSLEDISRVALFAGPTLLGIVQAQLPLITKVKGNREQFVNLTLQELQDIQAITRLEQDLLRQMTDIAYNEKLSLQQITQELRRISQLIIGQPIASPAAVGLASIYAAAPDLGRSVSNFLNSFTEGEFSPFDILGRAIAGAVVGGLIGAGIGFAIAGPPGAEVGLVAGVVIGAVAGAAAPLIDDAIDAIGSLF